MHVFSRVPLPRPGWMQQRENAEKAMQDGRKLRYGRKAAIKLSYMTNQNREMQRQMQVLSVVEGRDKDVET